MLSAFSAVLALVLGAVGEVLLAQAVRTSTATALPHLQWPQRAPWDSRLSVL